METNKYKNTAGTYGITTIIATAACIVIFFMYLHEAQNKPTCDYKERYDSLLTVCKTNAKTWDTFYKKSEGYYFINPKERAYIKKFDLKKFTEK